MMAARFWKVPVRSLIAAAGLAVVLQGLFRLITKPADLPAMFGGMLTVAAARLHRDPDGVGKAYRLFIVAWAGLGEELFYRAYLRDAAERPSRADRRRLALREERLAVAADRLSLPVPSARLSAGRRRTIAPRRWRPGCATRSL
jgi:hypothetical protein